ncbi:MAG TPA: hypothetical protein VE987_14720 [Polyangiaceae bacterium]|nr:hypothetical protein [Polyangiaceae bacterium]
MMGRQLSIPGTTRFQPQAWLRGDEQLRQAARAQRKAKAMMEQKASLHLAEVEEQIGRFEQAKSDIETKVKALNEQGAELQAKYVDVMRNLERLHAARTALRHVGATLPSDLVAT